MVTGTTTRKCPSGHFYRKRYTRQGRRVAGRCIRKQTRAAVTSRQYAATLKKRMGIRMRGFRKSRRTLRGSCPAGTIRRAAYVRVLTKKGKSRSRSRSKRVYVPAACIRDIGAAGKGLRSTVGPGIGPLKSGNLVRYGYQRIANLPQNARRSALRQAVSAYGALTVWRKLNALSIYTRRTSPATSRTAKADMDWIRATWGLKAF